MSTLLKKVMTVLLLVFATSQIWATTIAQTISFKKEKATINQILKEIQQQTDYSFIYNPEDLKIFL